MCQDTGTAIVMGKKSEGVLTGADDGEAISRGRVRRLHQAQPALLPARAADDVGGEEHRHQPAGADRALLDAPGTGKPAYKFLFMAKGGGSANKSFLFQETKAVLNPKRMLEFLDEKIRSLGTAACPPYHLAVVIGGTSRGVRAEDREVRLARTTSTTCPTDGLDGGARLPRPRARGGGLRADPVVRDRRAVRRQVLLPRRARRPAAPARRLAARSRSRCPARPTGRRSARSPPRASSSSSSRPTRRSSCRTRPTTHLDGRRRRRRSTSTGRWPRSSPSCRSTR